MPRSVRIDRQHADATPRARDRRKQSRDSHDTRRNPRPVRAPRSDGIRRRHRRRRARPGLATAIRLKQLAAEHGTEVSVVVLEKGSEPGAHILSGAIMDPRALTELIPDWKEQGAPLNQPVTDDSFLFLTETGATRDAELRCCPTCFQQPRQLHRQPRQRRALAGAAGRGARRRDLPRLSRGRGAVRRRTARSRASPPATWASARTASRPTNFQLGMELHAQVHDLRRRLARPASARS